MIKNRKKAAIHRLVVLITHDMLEEIDAQTLPPLRKRADVVRELIERGLKGCASRGSSTSTRSQAAVGIPA